VRASFTDVLSSDLKPLCSRDNHIMKYQTRPPRSNVKNGASYYCGFIGCSVRYHSADGYYTLIGMPDHANSVDESGVNLLQCPNHDRWLYRRTVSTRKEVFAGVAASKAATMVSMPNQKAIKFGPAKEISVTIGEPASQWRGGNGGSMHMTNHEVNGVSVVALDGRIVLGEESNSLREKLKKLVADGKKKIVLNVDKVRYIDSAGLGTLIAGHISAQKQGVTLRLSNLGSKFHEMLQITKLVTVFDVYDTEAAAISSFLRRPEVPGVPTT
jgi:anti-sigma B factor antagonist